MRQCLLSRGRRTAASEKKTKKHDREQERKRMRKARLLRAATRNCEKAQAAQPVFSAGAPVTRKRLLRSVQCRFDLTLGGPQKLGSQRIALRFTLEVRLGGARMELKCQRISIDRSRKKNKNKKPVLGNLRFHLPCDADGAC